MRAGRKLPLQLAYEAALGSIKDSSLLLRKFELFLLLPAMY